MDRHNLWPGNLDQQLFDLTRHVGENSASLRALERSTEQAREQLVRVEQAVAGLPGELSADLTETLRREAASLRERQEEHSRQIAYLTTRFNDADAATKERWRLAKIAMIVLSGLWAALGWFMTKFGPAIFNVLGFGNPGAGR